MPLIFEHPHVGVDYGFRDLATLSSGEKLNGDARKVATHLATKYKVICVEMLDLPQSKRFFAQLEKCCALSEATIVKVGVFFPSTRRCSACGHVGKKLPLKVRAWTCKQCNTTHDRDVNAAKNILAEGLRLLPLQQGQNA